MSLPARPTTTALLLQGKVVFGFRQAKTTEMIVVELMRAAKASFL
jgi:hypothetical protein